jgi:glycerol dehydrogenase
MASARTVAVNLETDRIRSFEATPQYFQGPGAIERIGQYSRGLGDRCLVIIDKAMAATLSHRIQESMDANGIDAKFCTVDDEVTWAVINGLSKEYGETRFDFCVAVGGGKALDIGKGVSRSLEVPVVTVPTIASNDSPASRVIAVYDESHQLIDVAEMRANPVVVVVDTEVIMAAPFRFLAAGIGDALSKRFEARACFESGGVNSRGRQPLHSALAIADGCYVMLRLHAALAMESSRSGVIDEHFEAIIEANILLSGLAFENGGLSIAHAMTRGLMTLEGPQSHLHGEHVAYGLLVQLALDSHRTEELDDVRSFLGSLGLPTRLSHLDCAGSEDDLEDLVRGAMTAPHIRNFPDAVTAERLRSAVVLVESL